MTLIALLVLLISALVMWIVGVTGSRNEWEKQAVRFELKADSMTRERDVFRERCERLEAKIQAAMKDLK
jgi:Na+-transporting methylmalonyl-CoA/oxaloacetate decarboxylase gamma subunit